MTPRTPAVLRDAILLVDDDLAIRRAVKRTLTQQVGCSPEEILEASDGDTALATIRQMGHRLRLVITDCDMPGRAQGREVATAAREAGSQAIAVMSGTPENLEGFPPATHTIEKPWDNAELTAWLTKNLGMPSREAPHQSTE